jgi:phosphoserine phosphatase RsbU/P
MVKHKLQCSQVWGGVRDEDVDACSSSLDVSLVSMACEGGKGGDIYFFSVCDGDLLTRVALADVVGHGTQVSGISEWLFDAMRRQMNTLDGNQILTDLNCIAVERGLAAMTTAAVAAFYRADSQFYFSYAGHHPALILRSEESRWRAADIDRRQDLSNLPLGVLADAAYEQGELPLSRGDRIVMYTDGLIEAPNARGELFGIDRLCELLDRHAREELVEIKRAVVDAVRAHTGGSLSHDDVTLLIAEAR